MKKEITRTMEEGLDAIMAILENAPNKESVSEVNKPQETIYDGRGHAVSVNGKSTTVGYKKGAKKVKTAKDSLREELMSTVEVILAAAPAFEGKVGTSKQEGVIVRMADADYTVKVTAHAKPEFANREAGFTPEKSYITRGKTENHSPAIAKVLVAEIENENSKLKIKNENLIQLLEAKASGVRIEIHNLEYTLKITRKRARVVMA